MDTRQQQSWPLATSHDQRGFMATLSLISTLSWLIIISTADGHQLSTTSCRRKPTNVSLRLSGAMRRKRSSVLHIKHECFLTCLKTCPVYCNSMNVILIFSLLFLVAFVGAAPLKVVRLNRKFSFHRCHNFRTPGERLIQMFQREALALVGCAT